MLNINNGLHDTENHCGYLTVTLSLVTLYEIYLIPRHS